MIRSFTLLKKRERNFGDAHAQAKIISNKERSLPFVSWQTLDIRFANRRQMSNNNNTFLSSVWGWYLKFRTNGGYWILNDLNPPHLFILRKVSPQRFFFQDFRSLMHSKFQYPGRTPKVNTVQGPIFTRPGRHFLIKWLDPIQNSAYVHRWDHRQQLLSSLYIGENVKRARFVTVLGNESCGWAIRRRLRSLNLNGNLHV